MRCRSCNAKLKISPVGLKKFSPSKTDLMKEEEDFCNRCLSITFSDYNYVIDHEHQFEECEIPLDMFYDKNFKLSS